MYSFTYTLCHAGQPPHRAQDPASVTGSPRVAKLQRAEMGTLSCRWMGGLGERVQLDSAGNLGEEAGYSSILGWGGAVSTGACGDTLFVRSEEGSGQGGGVVPPWSEAPGGILFEGWEHPRSCERAHAAQRRGLSQRASWGWNTCACACTHRAVKVMGTAHLGRAVP